MKTIKYLLSAAMLVVATSASAQFASGGGFSAGSADTEDYSRLKISYARGTPSYDSSHSIDADAANGFAVEYDYGMNIMPNVPLFLEYGANVTFLMHSEEESGYESKNKMLFATIPVNVVYKFAITDDFGIEPHVGLGFRFNILGKGTVSYGGSEADINYFDEDDMGEDYTWNRFQLCGQAGLGLTYTQWYLGWEYSWNFMELAKKQKLNTQYISIGYTF